MLLFRNTYNSIKYYRVFENDNKKLKEVETDYVVFQSLRYYATFLCLDSVFIHIGIYRGCAFQFWTANVSTSLQDHYFFCDKGNFTFI